MRSALFTFALAATLAAHGASIDPSVSRDSTTRRLPLFAATQRLIHLPDGSNLLIYQPDPPDGRPPRMDVFIVARGDDAQKDRSFRLELFIPDQIAKDYPGQIRSVAMSSDHQWLAAVGGWLGVRDQHGHNGVFVLHNEGPGGFWRLKSWFDVPDMAVGDIAFGPDDLLLVTSRPHRPSSAEIPIVTLFSFGGQSLGSFVPSSNHSNALEMRLLRTGENSYALYDPEIAQVRYLSLTSNHTVVQERAVPIPFSTDRLNLIAFDPLPDGRTAFARTVVENHHGKTIVSVVRADGGVADEWIAPETWTYGYADEQHVIHGFSHVPREGDMRMNITSVTVH